MSEPGGVDGVLADASLALALRIAAAAAPAPGGCTWEADIVVGVEGRTPVIGRGDVGPTLYDGTAGIALALAAAATAAAEDVGRRLRDTARAAAGNALLAAPDLVAEGRLGLFDGATGIALTAVMAGRALQDAALNQRGAALARDVIARLPPLVDGMEPDLIGGLAGVMLGVQQTMRAAGEEPPVELLVAAGRHLAAAATPATWGAAWSSGAGQQPLLGLGHGAAGIALALAESAALSGDAALGRASVGGLEYERGWFDAERVAWPDLRDAVPGAEPPGWMNAWCHGAIGIGLSRLRLSRLTADPIAVVEAAAAIQAVRDLVVATGTALRSGQPSDCSACHGLAGAVELLLVAATALGVDAHAKAARRVAGLLLDERDAAAGVFACGLPGAGEIPALMTGTAGIALTLLRASGVAAMPTPLLPGSAGW